jgi:hypothetical protein
MMTAIRKPCRCVNTYLEELSSSSWNNVKGVRHTEEMLTFLDEDLSLEARFVKEKD